jgi:hypothetical protein
MNATERLEKQLDEKDERIEALETELQELKDESESDWKWARHKTLKENPDNLPVPRLEMRWHKESDDGYLTRWDYNLIYRHLLGHLVAVPLGQTKSQGGNGTPPIHNGEIRTPFRDGVHICTDTEHLGIPAFCIVEGTIVRLMMKDGKCAQEAYVPNEKLRQDAPANPKI